MGTPMNDFDKRVEEMRVGLWDEEEVSQHAEAALWAAHQTMQAAIVELEACVERAKDLESVEMLGMLNQYLEKLRAAQSAVELTDEWTTMSEEFLEQNREMSEEVEAD